MKSPQHLFADLTALLEDVHGVAVEGQNADLSPDMQRALRACAFVGIRRAVSILKDLRTILT